MPATRLRPSFTLTDEKLAELRSVVPEAFADGKINWDTLREGLGEHVEELGAEGEHFGLFWPGKRAARRLAVLPSRGTLVPVSGEGINETTTKNLFVEGDNLEVLKLLQKSYANRVKMIYIDPPYNTGNDFVYHDDFTDPLADYLKKTGQANETGQLLTSNSRADGRFHSNWLTMMYPRLRLMRNLLTDDGVIFASIDDNEVIHLRELMNEIFGEENFVGQIVVQINPRGRHLDRFLAKTHEYVVVYAKDATQQALYQLEKDERMSKEYSKQDERGAYRELELRNRNPAFNSRTRPNLFYAIYVDPASGRVAVEQSPAYSVAVHPRNSQGQDSCWTWSKPKLAVDAEKCVARQTADGSWRVFRRDYLVRDDGSTATTLPKTLWVDKEFNNDVGKKAVQELFDGETVFDFPKPVPLVRRLIEIGSGPGDLVCDFFAGSCTSAQAVLEANQEGDGERNFLMVQLPEATPAGSLARKRGYETLAGLGQERIRRVIGKLQRTSGSPSAKDLGFRVLSLAGSNFLAWEDYDGTDVGELETLFKQTQQPLAEGWTPSTLLVEVMLLEGFPLDSSVMRLTQVGGIDVSVVKSDHIAHRVLTCFDPTLEEHVIDELDVAQEDVFVCLDSSLTDSQKLRLADRCNLKTI